MNSPFSERRPASPWMVPHAAATTAVALMLTAGLVACSQLQNLSPVFRGPAEQAAQQAAIRRLGEAVGAGAPLILDQTTAYPLLSEPVRNFHPVVLTKLTARDLTTPLAPGDYSIWGIGYCTQWSIHRPGRGVPYKVARIQGRQASAIGALLVRGTAAGFAPPRLNVDAWRIQDGVPLNDWPAAEQVLIHQLIPEYEAGLQGDYLERIHAVYDQARLLDKLPPLDVVLKQLGEPGQAVLEIEQARQVLTNQTLTAERVPQRLYQPTGDGLPFTLPADPHAPPSPWCQIAPNVFARFTCIDGNLGRNILDLRVTGPTGQSAATIRRRSKARVMFAAFAQTIPAANAAASNNHSPSLATLLFGTIGRWIQHKADERYLAQQKAYLDWLKRQVPGPDGQIGEWKTIITYSQGKPAQALIFVPYMDFHGGGGGIRG